MITELENPSMYAYIKDGGNALRNIMEHREVFTAPFKAIFGERSIKKVLFVGSGTSYNASIYITDLLERYAHIDAEAAFPTRVDECVLAACGAYKASEILVVGVSQSGTSVSTIDVIRRARTVGCFTVALTNEMDSPITKEADESVRLLTGKEYVHVETRGYICTLLEGYLIALAAGLAIGSVNQDEYDCRINDAQTLANNFDAMIAEADAWYTDHESEFMTLTRSYICTYGINACTAEEAELKLNETFHKPARGYELEEMIHGPHYALDSDNFTFFVAPDSPKADYVERFLDWYRDNEITSHVFVITTGGRSFGSKDLSFSERVPEELSPILMVLPFHIIAARNCINAGIDTADRPANRTSFAHLR